MSRLETINAHKEAIQVILDWERAYRASIGGDTYLNQYLREGLQKMEFDLFRVRTGLNFLSDIEEYLNV